ncbi:MAG: radical SAM protein [Actinobacteria bacterium]|nr:radical SAM protein [Actinomycetota bacterium]
MKTKYFSHLFNTYINYIARRKICNYFPSRIWIETTNHCNLKCRLCPNKDIPPEEKGHMDMGLFKDIVSALSGRPVDVYLFHRGEPLLHPRIVEMIDMLKETGAGVSIHTNATLLDGSMAEKILATGLDLISFSFDGYTKETYEKNRVNSGYETTLENILNFLKLKKQKNKKKPFTSIQVMEYDEEYKMNDFSLQKKEFAGKFLESPPDRFIIRKPHNWSGSIDIAADGGQKPVKKYLPCTFLWYSMVILYNGDIMPCPQDFSGRLTVGNFYDGPLIDIFNNESMIRLREKISNRDIDGLLPCSNCDRLWRKTFMGLPLDYLPVFISDGLRR